MKSFKHRSFPIRELNIVVFIGQLLKACSSVSVPFRKHRIHLSNLPFD